MKKNHITKIIRISSRVILGLIYTIFGGMGLAIAFGLMKMPDQPMPEAAKAFMMGIMATGYFFPLLKITETFCGLLLLVNRAAPVALVILAPITLHIVLFHLTLTPGLQQSVLPGLMITAQILAMAGYWDKYKPLFLAR